MQYKVPQHVDIEDKVVGSLTVRQFVIMLVAIALVGLLRVFLVGPLSIFFWPSALFIMIVFAAVAFAKYGDQNMEVFLLSAVKTFLSPRKRVWQKEPYNPEEHKSPEPIKKEEAPKDTRISLEQAEDNLGKLAELVDSGGYSVVAGGERANNFKPTVQTPEEATDILSQTEGANPNVDEMITKASQVAPEREELVSEVASVVPNESQKETPGIKLRKDQFYKNIR